MSDAPAEQSRASPYYPSAGPRTAGEREESSSVLASTGSLNSTYQCVQVYTRKHTCMFLIHQSSSSRVNCIRVNLQSQMYAMMMSNFKKKKKSSVTASTCWYIPVHTSTYRSTGIDTNHTHSEPFTLMML